MKPKIKQRLIDNAKDYDYVMELMALAELEKRKIVFVVGSTVIATKKPKNHITRYIIENCYYTKLIVKEDEDRTKIYLDE